MVQGVRARAKAGSVVYYAWLFEEFAQISLESDKALLTSGEKRLFIAGRSFPFP
jgi:hypothetical protein